jgi:transcriptional regulator with XRE-family HTH domain
MPAPRIGPRRPRRVFLKEWREAKDLSQAKLAGRLGVTDVTVGRWERGEALLSTDVMGAIAEALDIEPQDLFRLPSQPSADELLRGQPQEIVEQAIKLIRAIRQ